MRAASPRSLMWFQMLVIAVGFVVLFWVRRTSSPILPRNYWPFYSTSSLAVTPPAQSPPGDTPPAQSPPGDTPPAQSPPAQPPPNRCFQPDTGREKVPLVAVSGTNTLLIAAYLDLRKTRPEVRIITVALRSEQAAYRCLLCCQGQPHITAGAAYVHSDHFGFDYGTADIFCLPPAGCPDPSHVAVSAVAAPTENRSSEEQPRFLVVQNRKPISKDFPHKFTVCFSTMFDFSNVLQLTQSMEMLRFLGVTKVVLYKTSCSADTQRLLDYYEHTGVMEVIAWPMARRLKVSHGWRPEVSPGQLHYYGQVPALNDCVYRNMYRSSYLGLHDVDELILPQAVDSWTELLPLLERDHGAGRGYMFHNFVFPSSVSRTPPTGSPEARPPMRWRGVEGVNILDHLYYEPLDAQGWDNFKILVDPRAVNIPTVHGLLESLWSTVPVPSHVARMYHTRAPVMSGLKPENLTFDARLLAYRERLVPAVNAVLEATGLLHPTLGD